VTDISAADSRASDCPDSTSSLSEILLMTEQMVDLARNNQWDQVTELEEIRRRALSRCFSEPIPDQYSDLYSEALAAMLQLNEEVISLLEMAKSEVAIKRTDQVRTRKSIGHYLDVSDQH
jgi:hypothetical protein